MRALLPFLALMALAWPPAKGAPAGMALMPAGVYRRVITAPDAPETEPVAAFFLDIRPVTNTEFLAFVRENSAWRRSRVSPLFAEPGYLADWLGDLELGPLAPPDAPVVRVSWFAARAYAQWRGKRLPTTAEWERAASVGFAGENGNAEPAYREAVLNWFAAPSPAVPPPSGSGRPNSYGIHDLLDLVWEWVEDFNTGLLGGGSGPAGEGEEGLFCGAAAAGSRRFTDYPAFMRAGFRSALRASYVMPNLGFRCAQSL